MVERKYILNFTPTGMIPTREMTPHVPITPGEIVAQVEEAVGLGANMIHLHARNPDTGLPDYRKDLYARMIGPLRERFPELVLGVSTSGRNFSEFAQRAEVLELTGDLRPDFASLTLSSLNFNQQASVNSPQMIQDLASAMLDRGIRPELEALDLGMINYGRYLIRKELVNPPFYFNLILGNIACAQADLMHLGLMVRELPAGSVWSAGGVGPAQFKMNAMALLEGGGVRIGLEDNIWYDEARTRLATNRELVARVVQLGRTCERKPFGLAEARAVAGAHPVEARPA